jgi:hypothetical protein
MLEADEFLGFIMQDSERMPVTVRGIPTAKLATGHNLSRRLMFVCGMQPVGTREGTLNLRVLREIPEDVLQEHLVKLGFAKGSNETAKTKPGDKKGSDKPGVASSKPAVPEFRTWKAKSGHTIEAIFVRKDGDKVVLKRKDGTEVTVPVSILVQEDVELLKKMPDKAM